MKIFIWILFWIVFPFQSSNDNMCDWIAQGWLDLYYPAAASISITPSISLNTFSDILSTWGPSELTTASSYLHLLSHQDINSAQGWIPAGFIRICAPGHLRFFFQKVELIGQFRLCWNRSYTPNCVLNLIIYYKI